MKVWRGTRHFRGELTEQRGITEFSQRDCFVLHSENKTPVLGNAIPVLGMKLKRGLYVFFDIFQDRPVFSHII